MAVLQGDHGKLHKCPQKLEEEKTCASNLPPLLSECSKISQPLSSYLATPPVTYSIW